MIRILDKSTADKIAAGEVIDRPVSIIKELLENSLDADATSITVEIKNGGKSYIRVTDNGCGIEGDQAELAFTRHATSKISTAQDLDAIHTLGFRGEALASICAVARMELITRTDGAKTGRKISVEGSQVLENNATGCPEGTTVTVRDLFYNVPARQKFLASDSAETRRIVDMVSRLSLAYGDVKITLINNGKHVFSTRGNGNIYNNIVTVYGNEAGKDLLPVEGAMSGYILKGFVSAPSASSPSRSRQIFCVNGRIVSSKVMEKGLEAAYKEKLFHGRFPVAFLFLSMPAEKVDVNVHPTKKEIRFDDDFEVEDFIERNVQRALTAKEALPQIRSENIRSAATGSPDIPAGTATAQEPLRPAAPSPAVAEERGGYASRSISAAPAGEKQGCDRDGAEHEYEEHQVDIKSLLSSMRERHDNEERAIHPEPAENMYFDFRELDYTGTLFNTYIMASDEDDFYLIDQHAAHERVFYEKLLNQYNSAEKSSQQLLLPINIGVSVNVTASEETWIDDLRAMGYDIEFFGNNTYIVREIPAFMDISEAEAFLSDFFSALDDKPDLTDRRMLEKIIMKSCKSAVKGGDVLSFQEIDSLIKDLSSCVNPFSCPHGRPTFIRMTRYEIEKMFKRV